MKVLVSWLKEFAPFDSPIQTMVDDLVELGLSVEEVKELKPEFSDVFVAEVLELKPHPNADRIQLVEVGTGGETYRVCCGAFNMEVGDLVPFAKVGAKLPGGMEITSRKIRGEVSEGMICSAPELKMGNDTGGIMVLSKNLELGMDLKTALNLSQDTLFDIEVNPNRPDAMSVLGVARDLAAKQGVKFAVPKPKIIESKESDVSKLCQVKIHDPNLCGHIHLRVFSDVKIQDSPSHIANRLLSCGMRPINNIVDISNYVMLELGQPTHSFDLDKLSQNQGVRQLNVRMANENEKLVTLDGVTRTLNSRDGIIADINDEVISIAGVMGGASTEISESTSSVVLEAAWWNPATIAKTSRRLNLRSEASSRFERGVDIEIAELALNRIAELLQDSQNAPGVSPIKGVAKEVVKEYGNTPKPAKVILKESEIKRHLGEDIPIKQASQLLESIGFKTKKDGKQKLRVQIPSFRPDTSTSIDVIEEVARIYGYTNIARSIPKSKILGGINQRQNLRREVILALKGFGLLETISLPFLDLKDLQNTGLPVEAVTISDANEESDAQIPVHLRPNLRTGMLKNLSYNFSHQNYSDSLFEVGKVFGSSPDSELPDEANHLAVVLARQEPAILATQLTSLLDYFKVSYKIENIEGSPGFHTVRGASIMLTDKKSDDKSNEETNKEPNKEIGIFGQIEKGVCEAFNLESPISYAELNLDMFLDSADRNINYVAPSKYPSSNFDLAFWVGRDISAEELRRSLLKTANTTGISAEVQLFDEYTKEKRSLAFSLRVFAYDRTLNDKETSKIREACIESAKSLGAEPRV